MPQSGRTPRKTPSTLTTDPPLPSSLATDITAHSTGQEESKFATINQQKEESHLPLKSTITAQHRHIWATKAEDSPRLRDTIRDLQRFLTALPFPIIKITPVVIARLVCRVLASQGVMPTNVAFDIALLFWRLIINIFFRSIQPRGSWRIPRPDEGPVIFVGAPHHNQFLDALILASEVRRGSGRRVAFLIAEKSIKRKFVGAAARIMQSIPVARAADSSKPGKGTISVHPSGDPLLIQGHGTQFTKQLVVKGQIVLPKSTGHAAAEVVEVISDTELKIKKEYKDQRCIDALNGKVNEKEKQSGSQGCKYNCLPFVDQTKMYASVYESLAKGGSLGIFPEGGSHDRTDLLPLRAGVVIMALGAMSANPGLKVKIVPVGLSYFHPHKFRSRAVVEFGAPLEVPRELVGLFEKGGDGKRKAVGEMMDIVFDGLKSVTVQAPDYETLMFIQAGRRLYTPTGAHPSLSQVVELNRRFIIGYSQYKDEPRVVKLKDDILRYNKKLTYAGLRDHQVERATRAGWRSLGLLAYRLGLLAMWGGLALPGVILNSPVIILARIISKIKAREALAASQVKLIGRDVMATWKVLVSLGITPVLYFFYAGMATYLAHKYNFSSKHQILMPLYTLTILPTIAYSTLKFSEVGIDIYKSLPPLFVSLMPGNYKVIQEVQETRARIAKELHEVIDDLGPKVFENFEQSKIILKANASAPPQPTTPGREDSYIWKEKTSSGPAAGASYLSHPLTWADERLFGWGIGDKKARREKNQGNVQGEDMVDEDMDNESTESEEEEEGDYETVFRMLNPARLFSSDDTRSPIKSPRHGRSRSGSMAETFSEKRNRSNTDLKALSSQQQPLSPTTTVKSSAIAAPTEGKLNRRPGNRQRTHSLREEVPTMEIKEAGTPLQRQDFQQAGKELEEKSAEIRGGQLGAMNQPPLYDMKSAESTPSSQSSASGH